MPMSRALLIVFFVAVAVFGQTLWAGFVWDDVTLIQFNTHLRDPDALLNAVTWNFWDSSVPTGATTGYWRPLAKISHVLLLRVGDGQPWSFHLFNVALHAINSVLMAVWARRRLVATGVENVSPFAALVAGVVFALHPSRYEIVGWISCSTELIFGFFALLTAIAFERRAWWGLLTLAGAAISKETAVVLPVLFLIDALLRKELRQRALLLLGSIGVIAAAWSLRWLVGVSLPRTPASVSGFEIARRAAGAMAQFHLRTLLPTNVTIIPCDYEQIFPGIFQVPALVAIAGALLALGWAAFGVAGLRKPSLRPWLGDALWWLVAVGPVLQLKRVPSPMLISDRFLYLPVAGLALLLARLVMATPERHQRSLRLGVMGVAVAAATLLSLGLPSYANNRAFFEREFSLHPHHLFTGQGYARALDASGQPWAAQRVYEKLLEREVPDHEKLLLVTELASTYFQTLADHEARELRQLSAFFEAVLVEGRVDGLRLGEKHWPLNAAAMNSDIRSSSQGEYAAQVRVLLKARLGQPDELLVQLTRTRRKKPGVANSLELARHLAIADRWKEAVAVLNEDMSAMPELREAPLAGFILEAAAMKPQPPIDALTYAIKRAGVYSALGAPRRARRELAPFIAEYGSDARVINALVYLDVASADFSGALTRLDAELAKKPDDAELLKLRREVVTAQESQNAMIELQLLEAEPINL